MSKLPTFDGASLLRSSPLCLRRGRRRSFTGPISAHHDGLRGTPSTSTLGLALGRACRLRVEAPLRASLAATHALLAIASERSGAERPVPMLIEGARPPFALRGKPGGRAPGPVSRGTGRRAAVRPAPADTESLTQHGPAAGGAAGPNRPGGQCCATPCWLARGTEGGTPSPYPHRPGADQSTLGRGTAPAPQYRGQSEVVRVAIGLVTVQVARTVAATEAQASVVALLGLASLPGARGT